MLSSQTRYGAEALRVPAVHKDGRALSIAFAVVAYVHPTAGHGRPLAIRLGVKTRNANFDPG